VGINNFTTGPPIANTHHQLPSALEKGRNIDAITQEIRRYADRINPALFLNDATIITANIIKYPIQINDP
jgi:hypothetical protein